MSLTIEERNGWLNELTLQQLQALARRWNLPEWNSKSKDDLKKLLVRIENVEVPVPA